MHQTDRKSPAVWLLRLAASAAVAIVAMLLVGPPTEAAAAEPHETIRWEYYTTTVSIEASPRCLFDNGHFRYVVDNLGADAVEATLVVTPLEGQPELRPVVRTIGATEAANLAIAGRPDGRYRTEILVAGRPAMLRYVDVHCDQSADTVTSVALPESCADDDGTLFPPNYWVRVMGSPEWEIHLHGTLLAEHKPGSAGDPDRLVPANIGATARDLVVMRGTRVLASTSLGSAVQCLPGVDTTVVNNELNVVKINGCWSNDGTVGLRLRNDSRSNRDYEVRTTLAALDDGSETDQVAVLSPQRTKDHLFFANPDGLYQLSWHVDGELAGARFLRVACDPPTGSQPETVEVRQSCANGIGQIEVQINNRSITTRTYAIHIGTSIGTVEAASNGFTTHSETIGNGTHEIRVVDQQSNAILASGPVTVECEAAPGAGPAPADGSLNWRCLRGNGYFFADMEAVTAGDYRLQITGRTNHNKTATIDAGQRKRIAVSGRPDGTYTAQVLHENQTLLSETFTVTCDDNERHVVVMSHTCAANDLGVVIARIVAADPGEFTLRIEGRAPLPDRTTTIEDRGRIARSGRPDGAYQAYVLADGVEIAAMVFESRCQADAREQEVTISWRCVTSTGLGFISADVMASSTGSYALRIDGRTSLPDRVVQIAGGEYARIARSGRPPGGYSVTVLFNGTPIASEEFVLVCGS